MGNQPSARTESLQKPAPAAGPGAAERKAKPARRVSWKGGKQTAKQSARTFIEKAKEDALKDEFVATLRRNQDRKTAQREEMARAAAARSTAVDAMPEAEPLAGQLPPGISPPPNLPRPSMRKASSTSSVGSMRKPPPPPRSGSAKAVPHAPPRPPKKGSTFSVMSQSSLPSEPGERAAAEYEDLMARLECFYERHDPDALANGTVDLNEIAIWTLGQPNGFFELDKELVERFGVSLGDGARRSYWHVEMARRSTMMTAASGNSCMTEGTVQSFNTPSELSMGSTRYSGSTISDSEDLDFVLPPPPPPLEEDMAVPEGGHARRDRAAVNGDMVEVEPLDERLDDLNDFEEVQTLVEHFYLQHNPNALMTEVESVLAEYEHSGMRAMNAMLKDMYGTDVSEMLDAEEAAGERAQSVSHEARAAYVQQGFATLDRKGGMSLSEANARFAAQRAASSAGAAAGKWQQRKTSAVETTLRAGRRASLMRKSVTNIVRRRSSKPINCSGFELDMTAAEFGACGVCGRQKSDHKATRGPVVCKDLDQKWSKISQRVELPL